MRIMILGPMERVDNEEVGPTEHTKLLQALVADMGVAMADASGLGPAQTPLDVVAPGMRLAQEIFPHVMFHITQAELVIIDVSGFRPNVMYEVAICHALGKPMILIAKEGLENTPFYLSGRQILAPFDANSGRYDPGDYNHRTVYEALEGAVVSLSERARLSGNPVTAYFGLPLVDVSAPAGLATGYYLNMVSRFTAPHVGFLNRDRVWMALQDQSQASGDPALSEQRLKHLLIVMPRPDPDLNLAQEINAMSDKLAEVGHTLQRAALLDDPTKRVSDAFGGNVLEADHGIVVDLPRTVVTVKESASYLKIHDEIFHSGRLPMWEREAEPSAMLRDTLAAMYRSFERILDWHIRRERGGARTVTITSMDQVNEVVARLTAG